MSRLTKAPDIITTEWVKSAIGQINDQRWDDEVAHSMEDDLHESVLRAIAEGRCEEPAACAALALTTANIEFARWCA